MPFHSPELIGSLRVCVSFCHILDLFAILSDNLDDRETEFLCELEVTVIMGRYAHDGTGTVVSKYIVGEQIGTSCRLTG